MPAIWTDADGEVQRIYHDESNLNDEQLQGSTIVDSIPDPKGSTDEISHRFYDDTDGFYYTYETKITDLEVSTPIEQDLKDAVDASNFNAVVSIINQINN